ncbi:MAG: NAD(P)H-hydrate dehydratase [bacterium]|nr:NAD(P)H-hydrate dehydratase [bacterium]
MRRLATAAQMRAMDLHAVEQAGIPGTALMEKAGAAVAAEAADMLAASGGRRVLVCCGKGNNGGDGFVAARRLSEMGFEARPVLFGGREEVRGDAAEALRALEEKGPSVRSARTGEDWRESGRWDLIIDALLGTGIGGPAHGAIEEAILWMNGSGVPVLSVDLPSGLNADTGTAPGPCVRASRTVTFAERKRGLAFYPGRAFAGDVRVADIGIPEASAESAKIRTWLYETGDCGGDLPARPANGHKGTFGTVFLLAGSRGMTGAAVLSSLAALRSGAGLVRLNLPGSLLTVIGASAPEVITDPVPETPDGSAALSAEPLLAGRMKGPKAAVLGPGLGRNPETAHLVRRHNADCPCPLVLDADGLNAFEGRSGRLKRRAGETVLTPHAGELSRLTGAPAADIAADPVAAATAAAAEWNCVVVLKGGPTVTADPSGQAWVNSTGNPGMATAGSGDVLAGFIAGLISQGAAAPAAARCGVWLHGKAGDLAAAKRHPRSMIAGDLLEFIGGAFSAAEPADASP